MFFRFAFLHTGLNRFHSTDLHDMRDAILNEDQDGPDGGSPHIDKSTLNRKAVSGDMDEAQAQAQDN